MTSFLSSLKFSRRVLLPPTLAFLGFLALMAFQAFGTLTSNKRLIAIEDSVFPAMVTSFELEQKLRQIQNDLEEAAAFESEDGLAQAEAHHLEFLEALKVARAQGIFDTGTLEEIETRFESYFAAAGQAAQDMVLGSLPVETFEDPAQAQAAFVELEGQLVSIRKQQSELLSRTINSVHGRQRSTLGIGLLISLLIVGILGTVSWTVLKAVQRLADEVTGSAARITSASSQMVALNSRQEEASHQHAGSIEETRRTVISLVESARAIADQADAVLGHARATQDTHREIAERNRELSERLEGISSILESVRDIANKSEILALNAALEGTKAGEAGRGFSLVAVQMQRLAESVMSNVEDIKQLTREVRDASHRAVLSIEEGSKLATRTTDAADRIRLVTQQQESATQQVTDSMDDASLQIQQTVAGIGQSGEAIATLAELARQLDAVLREMRLQGSDS